MQRDEVIYKLPKVISIDAIYNQILPDLSKKYMCLKKGEQTAVSLVQTDRIDSNAIPTFVGILNILKSKSGNPVYLELVYNVHLLSFLDSIGFFSKLSRLGIIEYNKDYIGGFTEYHFDYNAKHKINEYYPELEYENKSKEEKEKIRDKLSEELKFVVQCDYMPLVKRQHKLSDGDEDTIITTFTELIINSQVYSKSMCYVYMQSGIRINKNKRKILLSIIDIGEGFKNSLDKKINKGEYALEQRMKVYNCAQTLGINVKEEWCYITIMEVLYYSQNESHRKINLYNLKKLLAQSHAIFRIHYKNVQVVFTYERCHKCRNNTILNCMECLWKSKKNAKTQQKSPIKKYPISLAGVHMDIEFIWEDKNV